MAVDLEVPVGIGGEPVVLVAVEDYGRVVADPALTHEALELLLRDDVADELVLEVLLPVQLDRARDVAVLVDVGILVHLRDDEPRVAEMLEEPVSRDEDFLRVAIRLHYPSSYFLILINF